ncbi:MAG: type III-A CRISPR-associated RAMP protein Csm4 [Candidatus Marinimicrobia bacterium]|nr:type III-A CRISPR-associated RAMP protein Csm4 [Candidatus Neomarinimicrobiota bacterium]
MNITKLYPPKNNSFVLDNLPFRSMTLFGALANCFVTLYGDEKFPEFIEQFENGSVGSLFPALKINDKEIFFFPKPYLSKVQNKDDKDGIIFKKKIKKIRWLSYNAMKIFGNSIKNIDGEYYHSVDFLQDFDLIGGEFLIAKNELKPEIINKLSSVDFYKKKDNIRVYIPRFDKDSKPFTQSEISLINRKLFFKKNKFVSIEMFLYFPDSIDDNEKWVATKQLLIDEGIGGKRHLGKGYFRKIDTVEAPFDSNDNPKLFLLLSNLIPKKEELENILSYDIGTDDGYITHGYASTYKKDKIFFLKEGAVIDKIIDGKIVSQEFKDNKIYRYGRAYLFPMGVKDE